MQKHIIEENIKEMISDLTGMEIDFINDESNFVDDLGYDSLDRIELVVTCESKFDILVDEKKTFKIQTFGEFVELINQSLN